jgi:hypothetical protein
MVKLFHRLLNVIENNFVLDLKFFEHKKLNMLLVHHRVHVLLHLHRVLPVHHHVRVRLVRLRVLLVHHHVHGQRHHHLDH